MKRLIQTVKLKKTDVSKKQFEIDSNCVFEALLTAMSEDEIKTAIENHGLKGPSYLSAAKDLRREALNRKNMNQ